MALVSLITFEVVVGGAEGHAGTLPQHERRDALAAFARAAAALHAEIGAIDAQIKFTIGRVTIEPNAPSVVPSRVSFSIDLRHPDNGMLDAAAARVAALCHRHAPPCAVTITPLVDAPSNDFDPKLRQHIARAAHDLGSPAIAILSAAGTTRAISPRSARPRRSLSLAGTARAMWSTNRRNLDTLPPARPCWRSCCVILLFAE
jgi:acetylornithine deacetylase/succinyl-diaminopimelate desuccinylase-like protein